MPWAPGAVNRCGEATLWRSGAALGANSIPPPQKMIEPVMDTPLLEQDIPELHISEGFGEYSGKYCHKFALVLSSLPLHKPATGHLQEMQC